MTGFQPSAVRAGLMGGLFLTAQYLGRTQSSWRALVVAGALMLFDNPLLLRYDVGFQLSFSAMLGVIFLTPFFQNVLSSLRHKTLASSFAKNMQGILAMTLGAVFFTLPVVVYYFDYVSFIAPLANMLIIPVLPWIMLFGFAFAFASFFLIELATIFSWFALVPLTYLVMVVESTSSVPFSASSFPLSHWIIPVFMYFVLLWIAFRLRKTAQESTIGM
jgi:competence protein ComEC